MCLLQCGNLSRRALQSCTKKSPQKLLSRTLFNTFTSSAAGLDQPVENGTSRPFLLARAAPPSVSFVPWRSPALCPRIRATFAGPSVLSFSRRSGTSWQPCVDTRTVEMTTRREQYATVLLIESTLVFKAFSERDLFQPFYRFRLGLWSSLLQLLQSFSLPTILENGARTRTILPGPSGYSTLVVVVWWHGHNNLSLHLYPRGMPFSLPRSPSLLYKICP